METNSLNRRRFLVVSLTGVIPPANSRGAWTQRAGTGANDRIRVGVIGIGNRSNLLIDQLPEQAEVVAVADCHFIRCQEAAAKRGARWRLYRDYRRMLDDRDIDGVIIGTTDHARALACIHACQAGKDVYAEKPLTLYLEEGRALVKAARRYKRVFQVGSQQRCMAMNRTACAFVRNGGIGRVQLVRGLNYGSAQPFPGGDEEPVPETLDWDMWLGQTEKRLYNSRVHRSWMSWRDFSGGDTTNWGAHGLDQVQSAVGMDGTGPVEWWPLEDGPEGSIGFRYANGITVRLDATDRRLEGGALFIGDQGQIEIVRNNFRTDPPGMISEMPPPEEVQKWRDEVAKWQAKYHMDDWLSCMRTRERPLADVEIGHRSVSLCHLANITRRLQRRLRWDPKKERFLDDREANGMLSRKRRKGYELPPV